MVQERAVSGGSSGRVEGTDRFSRVFDVLELLVGHPEGMTLTAISNRLDLPASSTHNLLQRMVGSDVLTVTEGRHYSVGARAVRLGIRIVDGVQVRTVARRHLQDLARETGEDIYLAVRLGRRVVYVDRVQGNRSVTVDIRLGQTLSLHATAVGKLFAAHHPQLHRSVMSSPRPKLTPTTIVDEDALEAEFDSIRENGYSVSREEAISGVAGYALPILDAHGTVVAAIHRSVLRANFDQEHLDGFLASAGKAVRAIESDLGRVHVDAAAR
jgi:DNA-binding IclR family transcriptional regulator